METVEQAWAWLLEHPAAQWAFGGLLAVAVVSFAAVKLYGRIKGESFDAKAALAFTLVQVGVALVVITGTYEFFRAEKFLDMPMAEAIGAALVIELCSWVSIGMIWTHADSGKLGTGPGGYGFGVSSGGGGLLAVISAPGFGAGTGRAIIVIIGVTLWWMKILTKIHRRNRPSRFMFSPYRIALRRGWIQVTDGDVDDTGHAREWQVRKISKAMRVASHRFPPFRVWGEIKLTRLQDGAPGDVLQAARDRHARVLVIREQVKRDSDQMKLLMERARRELSPEPEPEPVVPPSLVEAEERMRAAAEALARATERLSERAEEPRVSKAPPAPRKPAQRPESPVSAPALPGTPEGVRRDADGRLIGSIRNPARQVGDRVLIGEDLKADARQRAAAWLAQGEPRNGLGARLSREYVPPMSERWGQERVAEVPDPAPVPAEPEPEQPEQVPDVPPTFTLNGASPEPARV